MLKIVLLPFYVADVAERIVDRYCTHMISGGRAKDGMLADLITEAIADATKAERDRAKILEDALEFYANMDNQVPGTTEWDKEVTECLTGIIGATAISFNKPSKYVKDMGSLAREALAKYRGGE